MKNFFIPNTKNHYKPYLLRKIALVLYSLLLVFVNSFGGFFGIDQAQASTITPENIVRLTNDERTGSGLNSLKIDARLATAALAKANDMFEKQYWDHFGPNGETPWQFIRAQGYNYVYAGENLAKGFKTAEGVHEAWMASPTHKANLMSGNYKDIGVAVVEGVLLGKQTILVVQMFGNLTSQVAGTSQQTPVAPTKTTTSKDTVVVGKEPGEIKSIMITSPSESAVITDPSTNIQGEVGNVSGEYVVQLYDQSSLVGNTKSNEKDWSFDKQSDWAEGSHKIKATLKDANVSSKEISFSVDSKSPVVDKSSVSVKRSLDVYTLSFSIDSSWNTLKILNGSKVIEVQSEDKQKITVQIPVSVLGEKISIVATDIVGNMSELDVTEYFPQTEKDNSKFSFVLSAANTNWGDKISIGIVAFILILLMIEIFVYWRKGKLKDAVGDMFTIGVWWLILTIGIFNGFTGVIS